MYTITRAVEEIVSHSDFATEGLQLGCLNMSVYAERIRPEVASLAKKSVKKGSIVVALARLSSKYQKLHKDSEDFHFYNLVSRTGLTEITYPKTHKSQQLVASLYSVKSVREAPFFVSTVGITEIAIITHRELAEEITARMGTIKPLLRAHNLASLTMQVDMATIDTPRQSYTVIKQLALRDITLVEYITSPSELTIVLYEKNLKESFTILYDRFFASRSIDVMAPAST